MIKKILSSKVFRWTVMVLYAGLIYHVSSVSIQVAVPSFTYMDKLVHFIVYGLFCIILCWAISAHIRSDRIRKIITMAIIITSLYGFTDEAHQYFVPSRFAEVSDWIADTAGAVAAGLCWLIIIPIWERWGKG